MSAGNRTARMMRKHLKRLRSDAAWLIENGGDPVEISRVRAQISILKARLEAMR